MCVVSAVFPQIQPWIDQFPVKVPTQEDAETARKLEEVLRRLDEIDRKLGLKDCQVEAEIKATAVAKLRDIINTVEKS